MTPTQLTLKELRKRGYVACIVEKWNHFAKIRQDFGGFADILAFSGEHIGVLAVQATSSSNVSARVKKTQDNANLAVWCKAGNTFEVWGWAKQGPKGKRKVYTLRAVEITNETKTEANE